MKQEAIETRLLDLLESKAFEELDPSEREWVLLHLSETEYRLQWTIIQETDDLVFPEADVLPLELPGTKTAWYKQSVPLYQVLSVAAVFAIMIWIFRQPDSGNPIRISIQPVINPLAAISTVVHDTIYKPVPVIHRSVQIVHDTIQQAYYELNSNYREQRPLKLTREFEPMELNERLIKSQSLSLKEDKSANLLTNIPVTERMGSK